MCIYPAKAYIFLYKDYCTNVRSINLKMGSDFFLIFKKFIFFLIGG